MKAKKGEAMKSLLVLVIDDEEADMELAAGMLRQQGHTVLTARNGVEGMKIAEQEHPDLILMDVVMPEINGFQATRQLSRNEATRDIPVIMVSCKDEEMDRIWAMKQGARAYLTKQLNKASLFNAIATVMA